MKGVYALTEAIKRRRKEEEVAQTTEEAVEESKPTSELEEAQVKATKTNTFVPGAEMCKNIQRQPMRRTSTITKYRSQDLPAILPSLDNLERAFAVEGLTDDVKKGLKCIQESLVHALKEEGIEEIPKDGAFDHNYHMAIQTTCR